MTTWVTINQPVLYVEAQNGNIVTDQDGEPMVLQEGMGLTGGVTWITINQPVLYVEDQNGNIVTDQDGEPMVLQEGMDLTDWTDI